MSAHSGYLNALWLIVNDVEEISKIRETITCSKNPIAYKDGEYLPRIPYDDNETERCSVCHVMPGGIHHDGCYMERCPRCGKRLISCGCVIKNRGM